MSIQLCPKCFRPQHRYSDAGYPDLFKFVICPELPRDALLYAEWHGCACCKCEVTLKDIYQALDATTSSIPVKHSPNE